MRRLILDMVRRMVGQPAIVDRVDQISQRLQRIEDAMSASSSPNNGEYRYLNDVDRDAILHQINYTNHNLYLHLAEAMRKREIYYRDMMLAIDKVAHIYPTAEINFSADVPVAIDTDDHKHPWGAAHDNTRLPRLVLACERMFRRPLTFVDLGCSGGGLVLDFILRGHRAFGIEGSDTPQKALRAEWRVLPKNLMTGDITKPFYLKEPATSEPVLCDVISMWEVLEHIAEEDLPQLFENIKLHLKPDGVFIGSVAHVPDDHPSGAKYHRTVQSAEWWADKFQKLGLPIIHDHGFAFEDFARGTNNGPIDENYRSQPDVGSHFVARRTT